jgi:hypothetical protein
MRKPLAGLSLIGLVIAATFISLGTAAQPEPAKRWNYRQDDPNTHKPVISIEATSFTAAGDGRTFLLGDMTARLYDSSGVSYKQISSKKAVIDKRLGTLAYGPNQQSIVKLR